MKEEAEIKLTVRKENGTTATYYTKQDRVGPFGKYRFQKKIYTKAGVFLEKDVIECVEIKKKG